LNSIQLFPETKQTGKLSRGKEKLSNGACSCDHFPIPVADKWKSTLTWGELHHPIKLLFVGIIKD